MSIIYKKLGNQDIDHLNGLIKLYDDVFEMSDHTVLSSGYLQNLLLNESIIFFTAILDNLVIGGLTAHILPSTYFQSSEVYIYDLAVKTQYQREGIGRKLIETLKEYCITLGMKEIFVQADLEDQHAIDFYKAIGGRAESVVHFSYDLPGTKK